MWTFQELELFKIVDNEVEDFNDFFGIDPIAFDEFDKKIKELHEVLKGIDLNTGFSELLLRFESINDSLIKEVALSALYVVSKGSESQRDVDLFGYLLLTAFELRSKSYLIETNQK